jgi:ADP-ribose pyrophosphatase
VVRTAHSLNQVPFAIFDSGGEQDYTISKDQQGGLANVAATVFNLMGYRAPQDYMPSLISIKNEPVRRTIYKGSIVNFGLETVSLPNQELMALEIVRHPGGAVIVAVDNEGKICMVKQFRHAAGGWIWELPAGILDPGESAELTARRELKEETGCIADEWTSLGRMYTSPGFCDEILHAFLARSLEKGAATPEAHEFIEIYWLSVPDIDKMIGDGTIIDAKSIVAIHLAARQLEEYRS